MEQKEKQERLERMKADYDSRCKHLNSLKRRNEDVSHVNHKIYYLLLDPFTFVNAYGKISKNTGALTKGVSSDEEIMGYFGKINAENIAQKFKTGTYQWKPVRRVMIPKPGKKKMRPVDTPTQEDRIVQEAIRGILESIYEPEFRKLELETGSLCSNYGFRPNKSTFDALETLKTHGQRANFAIEGDIVSAYNNVNHDILLGFLSRRIKDKKFMNLVSEMLKSGIMHDNTYIHSLVGTPQGGIVSPLLFNIYMLEFDKFVFNKIILPIKNENTKIRRDPEYQKIKYKMKSELQRSKNETNREEAKSARRNFQELRKASMSFPSYEIKTLPKSGVYARYADDWLLLISGTHEECIETRNRISLFLETELKLELDPEKTYITKLTNGIAFLGYSIRMNPPEQMKTARVLVSNEYGKYRVLRRTTSRKITISADKARVLANLTRCGFCTKNDYYPIGVKSWTIFDEYQIVLKYRQIMVGLFNYYCNCDNLYLLNRISYILRYSCAKTIATRKKITMAQVFSLYGSDLRISIQKMNLKQNYTTTVEFPSITSLKLSTTKSSGFGRNQGKTDTDPFRLRNYYRTKMKVYENCCVCGSDDRVAMHHLNSLRKIKQEKRDRFSYIRSQINRKQIPVCKNCHEDITHGRYDSQNPIKFLDEFIAKL